MSTVSAIFKRGTTLAATVTYTPATGGPANLLGTTLTSDIHTSDGGFFHTTITKANDGLSFTIRYDDTASWSLGSARWDIKFTDGDVTWYSETLRLTIIEQVTL
jgi:hypothetical protein